MNVNHSERSPNTHQDGYYKEGRKEEGRKEGREGRKAGERKGRGGKLLASMYRNCILVCYGWIVNSANAVENTIKAPQKVKNITTI